jgi:hypothetical protein
MEFTGRLITGDFEENTMTFEIEGEMTLQAGRYRIVQIEAGNPVKNNVDLADVGGSQATGLKDKIKDKIEVAKHDIKLCMRDFDNLDEPTSGYPVGDVGINISKSEVYHRGRLLGLEEALRFAIECE